MYFNPYSRSVYFSEYIIAIILLQCHIIVLSTITKNRCCYVITYETPPPPTQTQTNIATTLKEMYEREL